MTTPNFSCPKHGNIGADVTDIHKLICKGAVNDFITQDALPSRALACVRCLSELIDAALPPVREKK